MLLTDDQTMILESARAFAQAEVAPLAAEWDQTAELPTDIARRLGELQSMSTTGR